MTSSTTKSSPLNHKSIDVPMVPPCPLCGRTRIFWDRKTSVATCLGELCKHSWHFFPQNEPSIRELEESNVNLERTKAYYSRLQGELFFQSEKQRILSEMSRLTNELQELGDKRSGADVKLEWCDAQIDANIKRVTEIRCRVRAVTELTYTDTNPKTSRSKSSTQKGPKTLELVEGIYTTLKTQMTDGEILKSVGYDPDEDVIRVI